MGDKEKLVAKERQIIGKKVKALRREGKTPMVMYAKDRAPISLEADSHDFELLFRSAGGNTIVNIDIEKEDGTRERKNVLIHEVDADPVTGKILHADLLRIKMNEKITTAVPLHFVGDSVAVIDLQGSLLTSLDEVEVECLPADLPKEIEVDIAPLVDFETVIHVSDLKVPENVVLLTDPESPVARVEAPRSDEELEELQEEVGETVSEEMAEEEVSEEAAEGEEKAE